MPNLNLGEAKPLGLRRYTAADRAAWDGFVARSKNGTFLFRRAYMEYHADRFADHSLMAYLGNQLVALLPANIDGDKLVSHGGLTYGGWITDERMRVALMLELFVALRDYAASSGICRVIYKPVPAVYHRMPADEDLYALFRHDAKLIRRDVASALRLAERPPLTKGRKCGIKLARDAGLDVRQSGDIETFMQMEAELLATKHGARPTHTPAEMRLLAERCPDAIRLYAAYRGDRMLAGVLVFQTPRVAHAQYIASTSEGRDAAALDAIMDHLLNQVYRDFAYFDFGISTEDDGRHLNEGLVANKESYGARAIVYERYELAAA